MDWVKAKSILIIVFFVLNVFLLYNLSVKESRAIAITQKEVADISSILKMNNIELKASLPTKVHPQSFLRVEDTVYNEHELVNNLLENSEGVIKSSTPESSVYSKSGKSVEVFSNKKIIYNNKEPVDDIQGFSKKRIIKYTESFLREKKIYPKYGVVGKFITTKEGCELTYIQEFKRYKVFESYMKVKLTHKGITQVEWFWVKPIQFVDSPKDIKSPTEILLTFIKELNTKEQVSVTDVSLGYYFPLEGFTNASVSAVPAWKIETSTGGKYYYNAYEGYLEEN